MSFCNITIVHFFKLELKYQPVLRTFNAWITLITTDLFINNFRDLKCWKKAFLTLDDTLEWLCLEIMERLMFSFYLFIVTDSEKVFFISVTALSLNTILPESFKYFLDQYNDHV